MNFQNSNHIFRFSISLIIMFQVELLTGWVRSGQDPTQSEGQSNSLKKKLKNRFFGNISASSNPIFMIYSSLDSSQRDESNRSCFISNGSILTKLFHFEIFN